MNKPNNIPTTPKLVDSDPHGAHDDNGRLVTIIGECFMLRRLRHGWTEISIDVGGCDLTCRADNQLVQQAGNILYKQIAVKVRHGVASSINIAKTWPPMPVDSGKEASRD